MANQVKAALSMLVTVTAMGCVKIDGGAAELSWSLRDEQGRSADCNDPDSTDDVAEIRLCWLPVEDTGSGAPQCDNLESVTFKCEDGTGTTGFDLPAVRTSLFIEPLCSDGDPASPDSYAVPPPIVRKIEEGAVATLSSLLIVVKRTNCCQTTDDIDCNRCTCRRL